MEASPEEEPAVKEEPEEAVDFPFPKTNVVISALDIDIVSEMQQISFFCRLCLRELPNLFPLISRINDVMVPEMVYAILGVNINIRDNLPKKVCIHCLTKLDYAYNVRKEFLENFHTLEGFVKSKHSSLVENLNNYQQGTRVVTESYADKILRENRDIIRMRLIKKQEYLSSLTGEETIEMLDESLPVEEFQPEPIKNFEESNNIKNEPNQPSNCFLAGSLSECGTGGESDNPNDVTGLIETNNAQESRNNKLGKRRNYAIRKMEAKLDPSKCYICQKDFTTEEEMKIHLSVHVSMIPYTCEQCIEEGGPSKKLTSIILLHRHFRMHASPIKCTKCPWRVCTAVALYGHMQMYHREDTTAEYACEICGIKLVSKRYFDRHMSSHRAVEEGRYTCSTCGHKFSTKTRLTRHSRSHTNERPYKCKYCPKTFTTSTSQNIHERNHTGEKVFACKYCDDSFRQKYHLTDHIGAVHPEMREAGNNAASCASQSYRTKSKLFQHNMKCEFEGCNFVTENRAKYYSHKAKHALKFQCPYCTERFPTKQRLEHHDYVHSGIKQHCCEQCGKSFRYKNCLDEHLAAHKNERPHACEICGMAFVRERTLKEHRLKHSDELTYSCRHCDKKFKYCADLSKHVRTHTEVSAKQDNQYQEGCTVGSCKEEEMDMVE
ncbi:zinc finger protein 157-like [Topomyia yanbarensis]|uniref:zinc finger protein 157-like n=1 Tax=Topomyia yanbarensis TaxID=2498891 RepID=UPI00273AE2E1|nr:zinc finger protein 157-like [Topomyia yanbarensis]